MESYHYNCDAGSLALGNADFTINICNGIGDGGYRVYISRKRLDGNSAFHKKYHFETSINGTFNVYNYDCYHTRQQREAKCNILATLTGRYGIYSHDGDMLLEYWDEG